MPMPRNRFCLEFAPGNKRVSYTPRLPDNCGLAISEQAFAALSIQKRKAIEPNTQTNLSEPNPNKTNLNSPQTKCN